MFYQTNTIESGLFQQNNSHHGVMNEMAQEPTASTDYTAADKKPRK